MGKSMDIEDQETTNSSHKEDEDEDEEEEEEEEEALSLCDFPLYPEKKDSPNTQDYRKSSSDPSDFFEFFHELSSEMCHAEDIIFGGKLVPYKKQPIFHDRILKSLSSMSSGDDDSNNVSRRYCQSLPELNPTRSNSDAGTKFTRSSRSLDCKKLSRNSNLVMKSEASDFQRNLNSKNSVKFEVSKASKPRWYGLMFGVMKFPPEMELRDMKNRQIRLNTGSIFPAMDVGGRGRTDLTTRGTERRSSWGHDFLKVLSCKNHASVATMASSISFVPEV